MKKARTRTTDPITTAAPRRRRRRAAQYVLVLIGCIVIIDAVVGDKGLLATRKARRQYQALESALNDAKAHNAALREEARRLKEDPSAIEELARRDLGLIKPGEKLFILRDIPSPDTKR